MSAVVWNILWCAVIAAMVIAFIVAHQRMRATEKKLNEEISTHFTDRMFSEENETTDLDREEETL